MLKPNGSGSPTTKGSGLRPVHGGVVAVSVVVAVVVAFAAFSFVAGVVAFIVKLAVVVGIVWVVSRLVLRRASR